MSFVHLHCHSEYSLLDGANRVDDLIRRAQELEQPALAITDHGNLHAAWDFQEKAKKAKLKPIIGMEAYVAPGDRRQRARPSAGRKPYYHLVLLARDAVGYRNLVKLSSLAFTEGFYAKPRVDRELLAQYNEGIIVSSACMAGEIATHLLSDDFEGAREVAHWYADVFKDRYYLEVQAHASEGQSQLNERVFRLAKDTGLPVVATNDAHFLTKDDHDAHDVLLCIGLGKDRADRDRMRYDNGLYFKSHTEIATSFPDRPDVLENTLKIADEVSDPFTAKSYHVPSFPLPAGAKSENELLTRLATEGAEQRYGSPLPDAIRQRLEYELDVITRTGYAGYFLIVADFIAAARARGIPVGPGRGSAAGSLVAYALKITNVDPLAFDLLFERFLNPERVSMPDVDVDFCFERRGEVIEYVRDKYGRDSVCQIVTFGTLKSRAAIKDVGRVLGFTPAETDALAKLVPNQPNFSLTVKEAVEQVPEIRKLYEQDERYTQLLDYAIALEGLSRHTGVHAAGVVIAPGPVLEYVPVCTQASKGSGAGRDDEQVVVSQYDMNCLEKAGMLKMDFLGLTTLTVIHDALVMIEERRGRKIDLDTLPLEDPEVYRMLRAGRTVGVFQFESPLATDMLRGMRCDRFDDLVASNALMRPGPLDAGMHRVYQRRKKGEEAVTYALPELEAILKPTYGVITYQEQVMRIAQQLAGISLAEADVLRKAVGKKDAELIRKELDKFISKSVARGYDPKVVHELSAQIETFGRYGFNKSHSVAYSVISYHTAWLKAHYAPEFMAALLSSSIGDTDNVVKYIAEARELGLEVLAPDVNESGYKFTVVGDKRLRFGLGAIRNVGHSAIDSILAARQERPFTDLFDLCERVDLRVCNRRVFEALIASGALDSLGTDRARCWAALDAALGEASLKQAEKESGQVSLFGDLFTDDAVGSGISAGGDGGFGISALGDDSQSPNPTAQDPHSPEPKAQSPQSPEPKAQSPQSPKPTAQSRFPNVPAWSESERLSKEKEILGFYISGHPLEPYQMECELFASHTVSQLGAWSPDPIKLGVVITAVKKQISKRSGSEFARLTVEDFTGSAEVLIFPEKWSTIADRVKTDIPVLLGGGYSKRDRDADAPTFIVETVTPFAEMAFSGQVGVAITLGHTEDVTDDVLHDVRAVIEAHSNGSTAAPALEVRWKDGNGGARLRSRSLRLPASHAALTELRALLGPDRVHLVRAG